MIYNLPTYVIQEQDAIHKNRILLSSYGKKAFIITGKHSSKMNGSLQDVEAALTECGILYEIFDEVEENPSVETVMRARERGMKAEIDFLIAIGGGSPIDAAKAIAIMISNPDKDRTFLFEKTDCCKALPVIAIPTTCGTGSEVTGVSVLTVHEKRTKASLPHRVFPKLALIDPGYLRTAGHRMMVATSIDALGHLVESYLNTTATDYSRMFVEQGLRIWSKIKPVLTGDKKPEAQDYEMLMTASTFGGMAIAHTGTTLPHSLSYAITYELGLAHGLAIGYFLPGYIRESDKKDQDYLLGLMGFQDVEEFANFFQKTTGCGILPEEDILKVVESVSKNQAKLDLCPYHVDKNVLLRISSWTNTI